MSSLFARVVGFVGFEDEDEGRAQGDVTMKRCRFPQIHCKSGALPPV
jgi:hypothetical protein